MPCCLVELAFYICFNFLAISWTHLLCPCPHSFSPFFPSLSLSLIVFTGHICQSNGAGARHVKCAASFGPSCLGLPRALPFSVYYCCWRPLAGSSVTCNIRWRRRKVPSEAISKRKRASRRQHTIITHCCLLQCVSKAFKSNGTLTNFIDCDWGREESEKRKGNEGIK